MPRVILAVQRITRIGNKPLAELFLTDDVFIKEAGMGRGLLIGNCLKDRLISHVCHALFNSLPLKSVVVTYSYELSEEIVERLHSEYGLCVWQAIRNKRKGKGSSTESVQIAVPEKLYIVDKHVRNENYDPSFIHVVDPVGSLDRSSPSLAGNMRYRASNIARHKAVCEANGSSPYVLLWTTESCGSFTPSHMCRVLGLDALYYANGQTLRTVGFVT